MRLSSSEAELGTTAKVEHTPSPGLGLEAVTRTVKLATPNFRYNYSVRETEQPRPCPRAQAHLQAAHGQQSRLLPVSQRELMPRLHTHGAAGTMLSSQAPAGQAGVGGADSPRSLLPGARWATQGCYCQLRGRMSCRTDIQILLLAQGW